MCWGCILEYASPDLFYQGICLDYPLQTKTLWYTGIERGCGNSSQNSCSFGINHGKESAINPIVVSVILTLATLLNPVETEPPVVEYAIEETVQQTSEYAEASAETVYMQVAEYEDYTEVLASINNYTSLMTELLRYVAGFLLFVVVVVLCYFVYKFFRLFI